MATHPEDQILPSWEKNTEAWTQAVRQQQIESRRLITDEAIIKAVLHCQPQRVLDLGCGEGWLTRALTRNGITVLGVDGVADLIQRSLELGEGTFQQIDYESIVAGKLIHDPFDLVVCNFSLLGQASVERLLHTLPLILKTQGDLVIQTLHPKTVSGNTDDQDGWREGSWDGFSAVFVDPAPWYFRTEESWLSLLKSCGFKIQTVQSPLHPQTHQPVSLIMTAQVC
jgi:2-polyprenyl-3-methyl-5-hydroxy-6-metoxy-1,4-benzoquinol methylase